MRKARLRVITMITAVALICSSMLIPQATVTAEAAAKTYKITYKLSGGTNHKSNPKKLKKNKTIKLKKPTRKGYTFKGWYKDRKFKSKITKIKGTKKWTVYAKWEKNKKTPTQPAKPSNPTTPDKPSNPTEYTIEYHLNGGVNNAKNPKTVKYGQSVQLYSPTKEGYEFANWYYDAAFTKSTGNVAVGLSGRYTVYAKWSPKTGTTDSDETEKTPILPDTCAHNNKTKIYQNITVTETLTNCCHTLLEVETSPITIVPTNFKIDDSRIFMEEYCPFCGALNELYGGTFNGAINMCKLNLPAAYKCNDCNETMLRNDYDWLNEGYDCGDSSHKINPAIVKYRQN